MKLTRQQEERWAVLNKTLKLFRAAENTKQAWQELLLASELIERFIAEFEEESSLGEIGQLGEAVGLNEDAGRALAIELPASSGDLGAPTIKLRLV